MRKRGQSTLEYVIVLTAIVSAILTATVWLGKRNSGAGLGKLFDQGATRITNASGRLPGATTADPGPTNAD